MALRDCHYGPPDVTIPSVRDYMIVNYKGSDATMNRWTSGPWHSEQVGRGVRSLLTRGESPQWKWNRPIDVAHLYVAQTELYRVTENVLEHSISDVRMEGCVRVKGSILPSLVSAFEEELRSGGLGGDLYRSALVNQPYIHLLRRYAKAHVQEVPLVVYMADRQRRRLDQYVGDNLDRDFRLERITGEVGINVPELIRRSRAESGCSPHAYVLRQRPERARQLLGRPMVTSLKCIATDCGFSGQGHLVRHFRHMFEQTPVDYHNTVTGRPLLPPEPDQPSRQRASINNLQQPPRDLAAPFPGSKRPVQCRGDREHRSDSRL